MDAEIASVDCTAIFKVRNDLINFGDSKPVSSIVIPASSKGQSIQGSASPVSCDPIPRPPRSDYPRSETLAFALLKPEHLNDGNVGMTAFQPRAVKER